MSSRLSRRIPASQLLLQTLENRVTPTVATSPDWFEGNDTIQTASYLGRGGNVQWGNLSIHSTTDEDWLRFRLAHDGLFESSVSINFTHADGDLDMYLFNSAGSALRSSAGTQNNETISLDGLAAGDYYLRVRGYSGATNNYTFDLRDPQGPGPGDFMEDNDEPSRAFLLPTISGYFGLTGPDIRSNIDVDYLTFQLQGTGGIANYVSVSNFDINLVDIDLTLFDAGMNPIRSADTTTNEEVISLEGLAPGKYTLKIYPSPSVTVGTLASYQFNLHRPAPGATGDRFEPNNSAADAESLGFLSGGGSYQFLSLQPAGDQDWYSFNMSQIGSSADYVKLNFANSQGDIDFELYAANKTTLLDFSRGIGDSETISLAGRPADLYYIRAYGVSGVANPNYTLSYQLPTVVTSPDSDEENDTRETATLLSTLSEPFRRTNLSVIPAGDDDWYRFTMAGTDDLSRKVRIEFTNLYGDLDLELYDSSNSATPLRTSTGSNNFEEISLSGLSAGTYSVRIYGRQGVSNPNYTLLIDPPIVGNSADRFEPNNLLAEAADLGTIRDPAPRVFDRLSLHPAGDVDFYKFNIAATAGQGHYARISFVNSSGDLDLELLDSAGNVLARSNGTGNTETVSLEGRPIDSYYLRVYGYQGVSSPGYELSIIAPLGEGIASDAYEPNGALVNATLVRSGTGQTMSGSATLENLSIHNSSDEDLFKFTTVAVGTAASRVSARFLNADGDLTLELLNSTGKVLATSDTSGDGESISLQGRPIGTYYVRVKGKSGGTNGYRLTVDAPIPTSSPPEARDDWTIFVYMTASDLAKYAAKDINEMEAAVARLPDTVNIVVLWDQSVDDKTFATANGSQPAWGTAGRAVIQGDTNMSQIATTFDLTIGEQNTGVSATLSNFLSWGVKQAPANNYGLVMWDHGGGLIGGFNNDDSDKTTSDGMTSTELVQALKGGPRMKFVAFDACLMQTVEMGYNLRTLTDVYVASQETIAGNGYDYTTAFSTLSTAPGLVTASTIGSGLIASYQTQYGITDDSTTLSAFATSGYDAIATAIKEFTDKTASATNEQLDRLKEHVLSAIQYYRIDECRDLGGMMTAIANDTGLPQAIRTAAAGVSAALNAALISKTTDGRNSSGSSIVAPLETDAKLLKTYSEQAASWIKATNWNLFLNKMLTRNVGPTAKGPDFAENNDTAAVARPLQISGVGNVISGLTLHTSTDVDWYRIRLAEDGGSLHRVQYVSDSNSTVTLELYNETGTTVIYANTAANHAEVGLSSLPAGTYLVKLRGTTAVSAYALRLDLPNAGPAGNSSKGKGLSVGQAEDGLSFPSVITTSQDSWFQIDTPRLAVPQTFELNFALPTGVSATVSVEDQVGNPIGDTVSGENGRLWFTATGDAESYYVRITSATGDGVVNFDMASAKLFSDTFDRTQLGSNYEVLAGTPTVVGGAVQSVSTMGAPATSVITAPGVRSADFSLTGTVKVSAKEAAGLIARHTGPGDKNYYFADVMTDASGNNFARIMRNLNGTLKTLKSTQIQTRDEYYLRFEVTGSYLELSVDGVKLVGVFDTAITGEGATGIRLTGGSVRSVDLAVQTLAFLPINDDLSFRRSHWLAPTGNFFIIGGTAIAEDPELLAFANSLPATNGTVTADVLLPTNRKTSASVIARYNVTSAANYYEARLSQNYLLGIPVYTVSIHANVNGKSTILGSVFAGSAMGDLGLEVTGNVITGLFNGVPVISKVNSQIPAAGRFGIAGKTGVSYFDFSAVPSTSVTGFTDSFNRADASSLGTDWQSVIGSHSISGNKTKGTTGNNFSVLAIASQENMIVSGTLSLTATGASSAGLVARYQGSGNANYYEGVIERVGTQVKATIYRNVAGRRTALGVSAILSSSLISAKLQFSVIGDTLTLRVDGNLLLTRSDTMISGSGVAGIRGTLNTTTDDFAVSGA